MILLIFLLILSVAVTYLSVQNTEVVSLNLVQFTFANVPIYVVILGAVLFGVVMAFLISFVNTISTSMLIRTQHKKIGQERKEVAELTKRIHQLELENVELRTELEPTRFDQKSL